MALEHLEHKDALDLAADAARQEAAEGAPEGWSEVAATVRGRLRSVLDPAVPILVHDARGRVDHDDEGSRTWVTDRVVRTALRRALQTSPTHAPSAIRLVVDGGRLDRLELDLVAAYGVELRPLADAVRAVVLRELRALLGPDPAFGPAQVAIAFVDVVPGDPRVV
ncbi:hypothetical protein QE364_000971 [Nocardioides zeae]|uniref:Uncharacterized protein n=1 Tax=Nocardioides zeae TaxID=1457234 RepID=A0ACC6IF15_9ACTN|nr:hypothetical protein [Nocardioides zeae]MDR6174911.1 hypothetical protein [Nocardioides zeae]MDR6209279.1 hypothetical protein [Nocardioides zeae]